MMICLGSSSDMASPLFCVWSRSASVFPTTGILVEAPLASGCQLPRGHLFASEARFPTFALRSALDCFPISCCVGFFPPEKPMVSARCFRGFLSPSLYDSSSDMLREPEFGKLTRNVLLAWDEARQQQAGQVEALLFEERIKPHIDLRAHFSTLKFSDG